MQQPWSDRLAQVTANPATVNYQQVAQLQTLRDWAITANRLQMLNTNRQAIAQAQSLLDQHIQQWATLTRQYDDLQQALTLANNTLNQYQAKQAELRATVQPPPAWQVTSPVEVEQRSQGRSTVSVSNIEHAASISLLLCFILVVWGISVWNDRKHLTAIDGLLQPEPYPVDGDSRLQPVQRTSTLPLPMWSSSPARSLRVRLAVLLLKTAMSPDALSRQSAAPPRPAAPLLLPPVSQLPVNQASAPKGK